MPPSKEETSDGEAASHDQREILRTEHPRDCRDATDRMVTAAWAGKP